MGCCKAVNRVVEAGRGDMMMTNAKMNQLLLSVTLAFHSDALIYNAILGIRVRIPYLETSVSPPCTSYIIRTTLMLADPTLWNSEMDMSRA